MFPFFTSRVKIYSTAKPDVTVTVLLKGMIMSIIDILLGTPWWVWIVLGVLLIGGIKSLKTSVVSLWRLALTPFIFIIWSLYSFYTKYGPFRNLYFLWAALGGLGLRIGWGVFAKKHITIDKSTLLAHIPGSRIPLLLSLIFFLFKYGLGVLWALAPETRSLTLLWIADVATSGFASGFFGGQFLRVLQHYYKK